MTYPRTRNGYVDDGSLITASSRRTRCPNCNSDNYRETVSLEECGSCGLRFDYWGGGGNDVFNRWDEENQRRLKEEQWRQDLRDREEEERQVWGHGDDSSGGW